MPVSGLTQVGVLLTRDQHERLKQISRETHLSMSAHLREAVDRWLAERTRKRRNDRQAETP